MKITTTADANLMSKAMSSGRYAALENTFRQAVDEEPERVVIASDLFDDSQSGSSDFDPLCQKPEFEGLENLAIARNTFQTSAKPTSWLTA